MPEAIAASASVLDMFRLNNAYGFLPFGSTDPKVIIQEKFDHSLVNTTDITELGSPTPRYSDGVRFERNNGLRINLSSHAAQLNVGGHIQFEIDKEYLYYYDPDDQHQGRQASASEICMSWASTDSTGANDNYLLVTTTSQFRVTTTGGTNRFFRLNQDAIEDPKWARVDLWWTSSTYSLAVDGQLLADADPHTWGAGAFNFLWLGLHKGDVAESIGTSGMGRVEPYLYGIRNLQISNAAPVFGTLPANYIGFFGDSYINLAQDDYSGTFWNGNADSYNGRIGLQIGAILRKRYGINFKPHLHPDGGGHHISKSYLPTLWAPDPGDPTDPYIDDYIAQNCHFHVIQASTNDSKIANGIPGDYEDSLKDMVVQLMSGTNAKGLVVSNTPSLKGRYDLHAKQFEAQVQQVRQINSTIPQWWDRTFPARAGRVLSCDLFEAVGGENVNDPAWHTMVGDIIGPDAAGTLGNDAQRTGQLGKHHSDLHLNAKGYFLATHKCYWPQLEKLIRAFG